MPDSTSSVGATPTNTLQPHEKYSGHLRTAGELMEEVMQELRRDAEFPLVERLEKLPDGGYAFVFHDREHPGIHAYDFTVRDLRDAMQWVCHMSEKSWVTKKHLRVFSSIIIQCISGGWR